MHFGLTAWAGFLASCLMGSGPLGRFLFLAADPAGTAGGGEREPAFQAYIFWAYGIACGLLLIFTLWTLLEVARLSRKVDYLSTRVERVAPEGRPPATGTPSGG